MNLVPGFYWVMQHESSPKPTIARLTKNGGWEYMVSEHSSKMIRNGPHRVLSAQPILPQFDVAKAWPDQTRWQRIVLLAQELASTVKPCGGCDNSNLEIPAKDCCVYDRAAAILDKMEEIR